MYNLNVNKTCISPLYIFVINIVLIILYTFHSECECIFYTQICNKDVGHFVSTWSTLYNSIMYEQTPLITVKLIEPNSHHVYCKYMPAAAHVYSIHVNMLSIFVTYN